MGSTAAFTLVLHPWKQVLGRHVHAHALVAGGAQDLFEYLGRYTHRVAISNERLLEVGAERVRLRARDDTGASPHRIYPIRGTPLPHPKTRATK